MAEADLLGRVHFWIGCVAIVVGFVAFASPKGRPVHRVTGQIFVISMALLALSGLWLSLAREILFTVFLSAIAFHALVTGWAAARRVGRASKWISILSPRSSAAVVIGALTGGMIAAGTPAGRLDDLPPAAFYTLAGGGDGDVCAGYRLSAPVSAPARSSSDPACVARGLCIFPGHRDFLLRQ